MERDYKVGIVGAGPAGCTVAYFLKELCNITLIDYKNPLLTLLPTGGGRCNLAHAEFDFKELAKNYPRGEKFLYSIFSKFSTIDTIELFERIGVETYTQEDLRIFPKTNSSKDVREKFLRNLTKVNIKKEKALRIEALTNNKYKLITDMNSYSFDALVFCIGGHSSYDMLERIGIKIISPKASLVGLETIENVKTLAGISILETSSQGFCDTLLFTHSGISGPLTFKISSIKARDKFPYCLNFDLYPKDLELQNLLNENPHKQIDNLLSSILPKKLVDFILNKIDIEQETKCHKINGKMRDAILNQIHNFKLEIKSTRKDGEIVTAGGVDLDTINPKTLEAKELPNLYFAGEVLNIDGFCGGFNLQNCWSTAFVVSESIKNKINYQ